MFLSLSKSCSNPQPAQIHKQNLLPDGKLKQAIINSKQQSFKNLVDKSGKLRDQIARPAEVQADISRDTPPSGREFIPSPELNQLLITNNHMQDHFHPLNQYFRPPTNQDARFPLENPFNTQPQIVDTKWLGGNRSPTEQQQNIHPNDIIPNILKQHGMYRNTQVEFPHHHVDRQVHFPQQFQQSSHYSHNYHNPFSSSSSSGERMIFPESKPFSDEIKNFPPLLSKTPDFIKNERMKGSWKWIPETEEENPTAQPESRFQSFHSGPSIYEQIAQQRPQTVRDRPYSFELGDFFSQPQLHTTPPTGPDNNNAPWPTAEALSMGEEMSTTTKGDESERNHLDVKLLR